MDHSIPQLTSVALQSPTASEKNQGQIYVNGRPAVVSFLSGAALASSPFLPALVPFINTAFQKVHVSGSKEYLPASIKRLQHTDHLLDTLGPDGFTILITQPEPAAANSDSDSSHNDLDTSKVIATVSAIPFKAVSSIHATETNHVFTRAAPTEPLPPGLQQWELKLMVVDSSVQKQGLASKMLGLVTEEVRRRAEVVARERRENGADMEGEEVHLIFSTLKENNYEFYIKRGFVMTEEKKVEPGTLGSRDGFTVVEMMKRL